jgi:formamidopyrimidine-DNA glycosylase
VRIVSARRALAPDTDALVGRPWRGGRPHDRQGSVDGRLLVVDLSGDADRAAIHPEDDRPAVCRPICAPSDHTFGPSSFEDGREIRRDIRKFGRVGLYGRDPTTGEPVVEPGGAAVFAGLGPEPLDDGFTLRAFRVQIRGRRGRLKPLLVDQSFVAGIGNIYADEALWRARLHPLRSAGSPRQRRRLCGAIGRSWPGDRRRGS